MFDKLFGSNGGENEEETVERVFSFMEELDECGELMEQAGTPFKDGNKHFVDSIYPHTEKDVVGVFDWNEETDTVVVELVWYLDKDDKVLRYDRVEEELSGREALEEFTIGVFRDCSVECAEVKPTTLIEKVSDAEALVLCQFSGRLNALGHELYESEDDTDDRERVRELVAECDMSADELLQLVKEE